MDPELDHHVRKAAFTIRLASEYAGLSRSYIYTLFDTQELVRLKAGRRTLIHKADLDAYLDRIRQGAMSLRAGRFPGGLKMRLRVIMLARCLLPR